RLEEPGALHLMEGRVDRPLLELQRPRAPALGLLQHLVAVHLALGEQAEDQDADGAGEELAVVFHAGFVEQGIIPCSTRSTRRGAVRGTESRACPRTRARRG